jgi:hypothetical protein
MIYTSLIFLCTTLNLSLKGRASWVQEKVILPEFWATPSLLPACPERRPLRPLHLVGRQRRRVLHHSLLHHSQPLAKFPLDPPRSSKPARSLLVGLVRHFPDLFKMLPINRRSSALLRSSPVGSSSRSLSSRSSAGVVLSERAWAKSASSDAVSSREQLQRLPCISAVHLDMHRKVYALT